MRTLTRPARLLGLCALVAGGALGTGCRSGLVIRSWEPGPVAVGKATRLVLLDAEGERRSAREAVTQVLGEQARLGGYFTFNDESEKGAEVKVAGRTVRCEGAELGEDSLGMRLDVHQWQADTDTRTSQSVVGGIVQTRRTVVTAGEVVLGITLFNAKGRALLAEKEFSGKAEGQTPDKDAVLAGAARSAIQQFLAEVTPRQVQRTVLFDTSEEAVTPFIKTAQGGNVKQAAEDLYGYVQANPNSAAATYNLAVMSDAMGDYATAMQWYDRAMAIGGQPFYEKARADCAGRKAAADALAD